MRATDLIADCATRNVALFPALDCEDPDGVLDADPALLGALTDQKVPVVRALVGGAGEDPRAGWFGTDWRFEWVQEVGLWFLRLREATDQPTKDRLRELLLATPRTLSEWLALAARAQAVEADLRRAGKLPPVPNFGD